MNVVPEICQRYRIAYALYTLHCLLIYCRDTTMQHEGAKSIVICAKISRQYTIVSNQSGKHHPFAPSLAKNNGQF